MKSVVSNVKNFMIQTPWRVHVLYSLVAYAVVQGAVSIIFSVTHLSIPHHFQMIPTALLLIYVLTTFLFSRHLIQKHTTILAGQEAISQLNAMGMTSFEHLVTTQLSQCGFTVVPSQTSPCSKTNSVKMIRNGEMHLLFMNLNDRVTNRNIQEYTNILFTEGIHRGIVISTGITPSRPEIRCGNMSLELIDGKNLMAFLGQNGLPLDNLQPFPEQSIRSLIHAGFPVCPSCQSNMTIKLGQHNGQPGKTHWQCSREPHCPGSISLKLNDLYF